MFSSCGAALRRRGGEERDLLQKILNFFENDGMSEVCTDYGEKIDILQFYAVTYFMDSPLPHKDKYSNADLS